MTMDRHFTEFEQACRNGDLKRVQNLLPENINYCIDYKISRGGQTPLILAVLSRKTEVVRFLLEQGADPNLKSHVGPIDIHMSRDGMRDDEPLYAAVCRDATEIAKALIEYGAEINFMTGIGSPLAIAASRGNLDLMQLLLENGANPNSYPSYGILTSHIPLFEAVHLRRMEAIALLYKYGVDINTRNRDGENALFTAWRVNSIAAMQELLRLGIDINARCNKGDTILSRAKYYENNERVGGPGIIEFLINHGAIE